MLYHHYLISIILFIASFQIIHGDDDTNINDNGNYPLSSPSHKSLLIAAGCFWCAEQAYEQYAPGVIEVVSGYAGAEGIANPTYRNHPGHYEVILIEYDPNRTSYELLLQYAWRNMDPFDAYGQFCDKGFSYKPAIFYANDEEKLIAEQVRADVLDLYPDWDSEDVVVPSLERPFFWMAEKYHQDYYIKNPWNYGYYKNACGRTKRLKEVWGEEQYYCYHDLELSCFNNTVVNEDGESIDASVNIKNTEESQGARGLPYQGIILIGVGIVFVAMLIVGFLPSCRKKMNKQAVKEEEEDKEENAPELELEQGTDATAINLS